MSTLTTGVPPGWLVVGRSRAALEVKLFFRDRQQVFWSFLYPTMMMVIFGSVFGDQTAAGGVSYPQYFLPGIAATGVMLTSFQALAIDVAVARDQGELARLQATPMPPGAYFMGKAASVLVTATGTGHAACRGAPGPRRRSRCSRPCPTRLLGSCSASPWASG